MVLATQKVLGHVWVKNMVSFTVIAVASHHVIPRIFAALIPRIPAAASRTTSAAKILARMGVNVASNNLLLRLFASDTVKFNDVVAKPNNFRHCKQVI